MITGIGTPSSQSKIAGIEVSPCFEIEISNRNKSHLLQPGVSIMTPMSRPG
jgi:hypothetical protein